MRDQPQRQRHPDRQRHRIPRRHARPCDENQRTTFLSRSRRRRTRRCDQLATTQSQAIRNHLQRTRNSKIPSSTPGLAETHPRDVAAGQTGDHRGVRVGWSGELRFCQDVDGVQRTRGECGECETYDGVL